MKFEGGRCCARSIMTGDLWFATQCERGCWKEDDLRGSTVLMSKGRMSWDISWLRLTPTKQWCEQSDLGRRPGFNGAFATSQSWTRLGPLGGAIWAVYNDLHSDDDAAPTSSAQYPFFLAAFEYSSATTCQSWVAACSGRIDEWSAAIGALVLRRRAATDDRGRYLREEGQPYCNTRKRKKEILEEIAETVGHAVVSQLVDGTACPDLSKTREPSAWYIQEPLQLVFGQ
jgi:hypothetical protein